MEDIFTNAQIHEYSLRPFLFFVLVSILFVGPTLGQKLDTRSKKAIKLFEKAAQLLKDREFDEAIVSYKKAIKKDHQFSQAYLKLANVYSFLRLLDSAHSYYSYYYEVVTEPSLQPNVARQLSYQFFNHGEYEKAREVFDTYKKKIGKENVIPSDTILGESILFAIASKKTPKTVEPIKLSEEINKYGLQYFPALTIDNSAIYFTKRDGVNPQYDEDIVVANYSNGSWTEAQGISDQINSEYNEGACTISADGRTIVFTSCKGRKSFGKCDLYISTKEGEVWSKPLNLGKEVNSRYWDSQPSLSADARTLYFSSDRPGGYGKRDIWQTSLIEGVWSEPSNLGAKVNSPNDETTPFIHVNGESLFFSSKGNVGMGGFDIYVSERDGTEWSNPRNLGYPINDYHDQSGLFITANGKEAYYTDETKNRSYIYKYKVSSDSLVSNTVSYLTGIIRDRKSMLPLKASVSLYDLTTQENLFTTESDSITGRYFLALREKGEYGAYVLSEGYLFEDFAFDLIGTSVFRPDTLDVMLSPIQKGEKLLLENVYFEFDSYRLSPKSESELNTVANFINRNPVKVLISGHTDNVGSEVYNQRLSEQRALSVFEYLLKQQVASEKVEYIGVGSEFPLFDEKKQVNIQSNRRIEFEIIEYNKE